LDIEQQPPGKLRSILKIGLLHQREQYAHHTQGTPESSWHSSGEAAQIVAIARNDRLEAVENPAEMWGRSKISL
jgi:hypothetical protein